MRERCPECGQELEEPVEETISGKIRFLIKGDDGRLWTGSLLDEPDD